MLKEKAAEVIARLRKTKNTNTVISRYSEVSRPTISDIKSGVIGNPGIETLGKIETALNTLEAEQEAEKRRQAVLHEGEPPSELSGESVAETG